MITHTTESYWIQVERQSQSYKFKEFAKIQILEFERNVTLDTPSEVAW